MYAASLLATAQGKKRSIGDEGYALHAVSRMPAVAIGPIEALCRAGPENLAVRDKALMTLGKLDGGRGAPALLAALNDDRARIAIYALREASSICHKSKLWRSCARRRLANHRWPRKSYALWAMPVAIRLMRICKKWLQSPICTQIYGCLAGALWGFLDREETWRSSEKAACDESLAVARAAIRVPSERLSNLGSRRWLGFSNNVLRDAPLIRLETLGRLVEAPLKHEGASLCVTLAGFS